jgi:hypothetical protein
MITRRLWRRRLSWRGWCACEQGGCSDVGASELEAVMSQRGWLERMGGEEICQMQHSDNSPAPLILRRTLPFITADDCVHATTRIRRLELGRLLRYQNRRLFFAKKLLQWIQRRFVYALYYRGQRLFDLEVENGSRPDSRTSVVYCEPVTDKTRILRKMLKEQL